MNNDLKELIRISRLYGDDNEAVIAGGGNTSCKNEDFIWVKASGGSLQNISQNGFVKLVRSRLKKIETRKYSTEPTKREQQVKEDLAASKADVLSELRPSVETSMHEKLDYKFVVHLHPTLVNAVLCAKNSRKVCEELFGEESLYIEYTDPGYILFLKFSEEIQKFRNSYQKDPHLVFLENHGIFISANSTKEIEKLYDEVITKISARIKVPLKSEETPTPSDITSILPGLRMMLSTDNLKVIKWRNNTLISHFLKDKSSFSKISGPFTPDIIVYCKVNYLYIDHDGDPQTTLDKCRSEIRKFKETYGYEPRIILIKNIGLLAIEDNPKSAQTVVDIFEDLMKISFLSENFGGPRFLSPDSISFIENWEIENYRRKVSLGKGTSGRTKDRIAIVTGGAMGFGKGIAENLANEGTYVIIADINQKEGNKTRKELAKKFGENNISFVQTDVSNPESVEALVRKTVEAFGGLDIMISNAGILYAGSLDEMDPETFDRMTQINYSAYFLCAKYASKVMKLQHQFHPEHYTDIIQINSKSGLKGSNKNFAYAGGKFGGIGLTQSFALELMPYRIKVNAICPGNFFEGPLWADPEKGLFVQYLKSGKVPGAKNVADVKKYYESQVPAGRGCRVEDVMKAIYYIVEQHYETGQAVPVTGGQNMLH